MTPFVLETSFTWNGEPAHRREKARLHVHDLGARIDIDIDAPFHDDPKPDAHAGSLWKLWEWEVVEFFVAGPDDRYLEIEIGPHGHYLVLRLHGERNIIDHGHPLDVNTNIEGMRWTSNVQVEASLLPEKPWRVNAYAIHGTGIDRRYLASFPVPGPLPDYHQLKYFRQTGDLPRPLLH